ncbi:hypothetical protein HJG60_011417 [Phyllostomus discolor]|uniref:Large ribosomal subunit protein eL36 n=1 Tax=Phyllostomus discolor TaxID=89673 RepID=A0A833ZWU7_9CHIR|nr:hypothetical protein HJG60_011417 [Phyllostomus discolor]
MAQGHQVTEHVSHQHGTSPSARGLCGTQSSERCGFLPCHAMELLKVSTDRRALEWIKKRVGTHVRAKGRREELSSVLAAVRKAAAEQDGAPSPCVIKPVQEKKRVKGSQLVWLSGLSAGL